MSDILNGHTRCILLLLWNSTVILIIPQRERVRIGAVRIAYRKTRPQPVGSPVKSLHNSVAYSTLGKSMVRGSGVVEYSFRGALF